MRPCILATASVSDKHVQIFEADPDKPNYMTFLLSRSIDGVADGGDFTLGMFTKQLHSLTLKYGQLFYQ